VAAELEDFESAIELYKKALNFTKALAPLTAVEQLANILSRHAPRLAVPKDSQAAGPAIKLFEEAVAWLDWLDTKLEKSAERLALRGALHKRWAMLTGGRERRKHLREAAESYREAHDQSTKVAYQLLNWLAFRYLLEPRKRHPEVAARAAEELTRVQQKLADNREPTFWDQIAIPDALLHVALFEGRITDPERALQVTTAYQNALKTGPSARERASVRDHLQFLVEMLSDPDYTRQSAPRGALQPFLDALA
jgi:tetratricopeptide (TPR) repeat protein